MDLYQPISLTAATATLTKHHCGVILLNRAGGITITLPAPAVGLHYHFIVGTAPTTAYTIAPSGSANIMIGGVAELEVDTGDDGPRSAVGDLFSFVANVAVVGDFVKMVSDGTSWYITGVTNADGGVTIGST